MKLSKSDKKLLAAARDRTILSGQVVYHARVPYNGGVQSVTGDCLKSLLGTIKFANKYGKQLAFLSRDAAFQTAVSRNTEVFKYSRTGLPSINDCVKHGLSR